MDFDIFEENEDNIFFRFSSILLFIYIYYSLSYYFLLDNTINKPHIFFIIILLILHLIHIIILKILYKNDLQIYAWLLAMIPLVFYLLYTKYRDIVKKNELEKEIKLKEKLKKELGIEKEHFVRNIVSQPKKPEFRPDNNHYQRQPEINENRNIQKDISYNSMVNELDNSKNMENLQQNRMIRQSMSDFQDSNQISENIKVNNGFNLSGQDTYFNNMSGIF